MGPSSQKRVRLIEQFPYDLYGFKSYKHVLIEPEPGGSLSNIPFSNDHFGLDLALVNTKKVEQEKFSKEPRGTSLVN